MSNMYFTQPSRDLSRTARARIDNGGPSFEQERRQLVQVVTPYRPLVATLGESEGVCDSVLRQHLVEGPIARARQHVVLADAGPEQLELLVGRRRVGKELRVDLIGLAGDGAAHDRDVLEHLRFVERDIQRLTSTHRQPGKGAVLWFL